MRKLILTALLITVIAGISICINANPFLYVIFIFLVFWGWLAILLFTLVRLTGKLIYKSGFTGILRSSEKCRNNLIVLACLVFFFLGGWLINRFYLPGKFHPLSLLGDGGILSFSLFLGWSLKEPRRRKLLFPVSLIFILFISLLAFISVKISNPIAVDSEEALRSLPYITWVPSGENTQKSGVVYYNRKKSFFGINLYVSENLPSAYLMDNSGKILHTWSAKINEDDQWLNVAMDKNGDLLAFVSDKFLIRLDWNSRLKWIKRMRFHHEVNIAENRNIYALARKDELLFFSGLPVPVLNDYIVILSPEGEFKKQISFFTVLENKISWSKIGEIYYWLLKPKNIKKILQRRLGDSFIFAYMEPPDIFHANSVTEIDKEIPGFCKKGDLLISARNLDFVGVLNPCQSQITWGWGKGELSRQHHPTLLDNGNILIFDNGYGRGFSRIVEVDPITKKIIWQYQANPGEEFMSMGRGSCQRLPNGNTLITESQKGRVFEVTSSGQKVWEFYNPEVKKENKQRASIYRMARLTNLKDYPCLKNLK